MARTIYLEVDFNQRFKGMPITRQKPARWPLPVSPSA
jgi:hypothetical protein